jgi:hypothetical protein
MKSADSKNKSLLLNHLKSINYFKNTQTKKFC